MALVILRSRYVNGSVQQKAEVEKNDTQQPLDDFDCDNDSGSGSGSGSGSDDGDGGDHKVEDYDSGQEQRFDEAGDKKDGGQIAGPAIQQRQSVDGSIRRRVALALRSNMQLAICVFLPIRLTDRVW